MNETEVYKFSATNEKKLQEMRIKLAEKQGRDRNLLWNKIVRTSSAKESCIEQDECEDVLMLPATQFAQDCNPKTLLCYHESQESELEECMQEESSDISLIVADFKEALSYLDSTSGSAMSLDTLMAFVCLDPIKLGKIINALEMDNLSDTALISLCKSLTTLEKEPSLGWCTAFMKHCILRKVSSLKHAATRDLIASIHLLSKKFPRAVVEGFMVPCVAIDSIDVFQCDIVCELFKDSLPTEHQYLFMKKFHQCRKTLNESLVTLLQSVLDYKLGVDEAILDAIISLLVNSASILASNLKFTKLILNCIREFGIKMSEKQCFDLNAAIETNNTPLKRSCQASLKKIFLTKNIACN